MLKAAFFFLYPPKERIKNESKKEINAAVPDVLEKKSFINCAFFYVAAFTKLTFEADVIPRRGSTHVLPKVR